MSPHRFIFTGAPGSGKTSVLQTLEAQGFSCVPEAATALIAQAQAWGEEKPWSSPDFIEKILTIQETRQKNATGALQFYDRSPFCTYALAEYLGFPISDVLKRSIDRCLHEKTYEKQVFFFENLGSVVATEVRQITFEEALIFEKIHRAVYQAFGFHLISVPKASVGVRAAFICQHL